MANGTPNRPGGGGGGNRPGGGGGGGRSGGGGDRPGGGGGRPGGNRPPREREPRENPRASGDASLHESRVININRVAKVVKGGRRFSFTALVPLAIQKGTEEARKNLFKVPLAGTTVTHPIIGETGAGRVLLKPAAPGTGVIAGGAARAILEEAGIKDVLCKSLGSPNHINVARATIQGLKSLRRPDEVAKARGLSPEEIMPGGLWRAYKESERDRTPQPREGAST